MSYQSFGFLAFSAVSIFIYRISGKRFPGARKYSLLAANIIFFAFCGLKYFPFLAATLFSSFFSGKKIGKIYRKAEVKLQSAKSPAEKKEIRNASKAEAKKSMLLGVLISLIILAVCKYTVFIFRNINIIMRFLQREPVTMFKMILPVGISFYTFMAVGYVLDVYWKRINAEEKFVSYAIFLTYFPHIVQGPIGRYGRFKEELERSLKTVVTVDGLVYGAELVLWGFFKKLVIADRLSLFVSTFFDAPQKYSGLIMAIAAVLYSIQIYADFSGCIDIVSGVSEMFGIKLAKNFDHPYFSRTIPEFWRRWHISLGEWFKDFVYFPVSMSSSVKRLKKFFKKHGSKKGELLTASCVPTVVVWVITGLWHGASWNYIAWGAFYAALMVGGNVFGEFGQKLTKKLSINTEAFSWRLFQMTRTFILCTVGRVFFRCEGLRQSLVYFKNMFSSFSVEYILDDKLFKYGLDRNNFALVIVAIAILFIVDVMQEKASVRLTLSKQNTVFRYAVVMAGVFAVLIFGIYGPQFNASQFIYEQF